MGFRRTGVLNWTRPALAALLADAVTPQATVATFDALFVVFYTAGPSPAPGRVLADYTLSALSPAGIELTALTAAPNLPDGPILHQEVESLAGATPAEESILGFLLVKTSAAGALWAVSDPFETPVNIVVQNDGISLDVIIAPPSAWPTGLVE